MSVSWIYIPLDFTGQQNPTLFGSDHGNQQKSQQRSVRVCGSCNFLNVSGIFCILVSGLLVLHGWFLGITSREGDGLLQ